MTDIKTEECLNHPKFQQLVASRSRLSILFSLIIFVGYGIFVIGMAFTPDLMSEPLSAGSNITYGIFLGILMIIAGVVCSGVYMAWANKSFDTLKQELLDELDYD